MTFVDLEPIERMFASLEKRGSLVLEDSKKVLRIAEVFGTGLDYRC